MQHIGKIFDFHITEQNMLYFWVGKSSFLLDLFKLTLETLTKYIKCRCVLIRDKKKKKKKFK